MKRVIFTADDFGLTAEVNAAVAQAHRQGVLTAASLMIGAPAAAEAVALAHTLPKLGVGLHVVVADGNPVLSPEKIPHIVDAHGRLPSELAAASFRWALSGAARAELRAEIAAQFAAFAATGLACDHVNAHNHMHLHPIVLGIMLDQARRYGIKHVRLPHEPGAVLLAPWLALMRARLRNGGFVFNDRLVGLTHTGHLTEARVLRLLDAVGDGVSELYFHPATAATPALDTAAPGYDRTGELAALCSPTVAARIAALGLKPSVFRDL